MDPNFPLSKLLERQRARFDAIRDVALAAQEDGDLLTTDEAGNVARLCEQALQDIAEAEAALRRDRALSGFTGLLGHPGLLGQPTVSDSIN